MEIGGGRGEVGGGKLHFDWVHIVAGRMTGVRSLQFDCEWLCIEFEKSSPLERIFPKGFLWKGEAFFHFHNYNFFYKFILKFL